MRCRLLLAPAPRSRENACPTRLENVATTAHNVAVFIVEWMCRVVAGLRSRVGTAAREASRPAPVRFGLVADTLRSRAELLAEIAVLRPQLVVAMRTVERPKLEPHERVVIVLLTALSRTWEQALLLVRPETVLRWHRRGFRLLWRWKSIRRRSAEPS